MSDKTGKEPAFNTLLGRDIAIVLAAFSLWAASDAWFQVTGLFFAELISAANALLVGYVLGAIFHEWGHYAGARFSKSVAPRFVPNNITTLFRFNFDFDQNNSYQFHCMSFGGWIAHWTILLVLFWVLPLDTLGRSVLVASLFGFVIFATVIEIGILKKTFAGRAPKEALSELSKGNFQTASFFGAGSGLMAAVIFT